VCNQNCYIEEGICCKNIWNKKSGTCQLDTSLVIEIVEKSGDTQAIELLNSANKSALIGEISKANAQLILSELKAKISLTNDDSSKSISFEEALLALNSNDYEQAELIAKEALKDINYSNSPNQENPIILLLFGMGCILIVAFVYVKVFRKV